MEILFFLFPLTFTILRRPFAFSRLNGSFLSLLRGFTCGPFVMSHFTLWPFGVSSICASLLLFHSRAFFPPPLTVKTWSLSSFFFSVSPPRVPMIRGPILFRFFPLCAYSIPDVPLPFFAWFLFFTGFPRLALFYLFFSLKPCPPLL